MVNQKIEEIEGIGPTYGEKLRQAGIPDTDTLLEHGATRKGRQTVAEHSGLSEHQVLKFVNMADLFRINGVGQEYADLLERSGVESVLELGQRVPEHLVEKMTEVNESKNLTRKMPTVENVKQWIQEAKSLPRMVEH